MSSVFGRVTGLVKRPGAETLDRWPHAAEHWCVAEIWIVSNFPPPVHGVAAFNAALTDELARRGIGYRTFPIGTRGALREVAQVGVGKTIADAGVIVRLGVALARARVAGRMPAAIYFTPCQGG